MEEKDCGDHGGRHPSGGWWARLRRAVGLGPRHVALSAEQEKQVARRALAQGDLPHCAHHAAAAIFADPLDAEAQHLLDELVAAADGGDAASLFPVGANVYAGTVAARAWVLNRRGRVDEAVQLVRQLMIAANDKPFDRWVLGWLSDAGAAARVEAVNCAGVLAGALSRFPDLVVNESAALAALRPYLVAAEAALQAHPDDANLQGLCAVLFRKGGQLPRAIDLAERAWAADPTYLAGVARAMAHQAAGRAADAVSAYQDLIARNPDDPDSRTDLAILLMEAGRGEDALRWAEDAVRLDPRHRTSEGLVLFLRGRVNGDAAAAKAFHRYLRDRPAHPLTYLVRPPGEPYVSYLPEPQEATINCLRQLLADDSVRNAPDASSIKLTLSHLEAPSSRLASKLALPPAITITFEVQEVPVPDPRVAIANLEHVTWTYDGTEPSPGLPPPADERVVQAVAALAATPYDVEAWWERAGVPARALGAAAARDLVATMLHPPPAPSPQWPLVTWLPHVQVAAALIVARLDDGWDGSARRRALESLVLGPVDWVTNAGLIALAQLGRAEGIDVRPVFFQRLRSTPRGGYCCYLHPLVSCALRLPYLEPPERREFEAWRAELEENAA